MTELQPSDSSHHDKPTPRPRRALLALVIVILLIPGIYLFRGAEPMDVVKTVAIALIALAITRRFFGGGSRPAAVLLGFSIAVSGAFPGVALATMEPDSKPFLRDGMSSCQQGLGLGDDFPRGTTSSWSGFPCWQLRMEEDFEGFLKSVYGSGITSLIVSAGESPASLALLQSAAAAAAVGGAVFVSWELLFASGCGACEEAEPFMDWELSSCGPLNIDCCVPPDSIGADDQQQEGRGRRSERHLEDPERPSFGAEELGGAGWQGAEDLDSCPGGGDRPDWDDEDEGEDEDCYDLSGSACEQLCPPRVPGECAMGCDTCGACIYSPC